jgi:hypothetical protein
MAGEFRTSFDAGIDSRSNNERMNLSMEESPCKVLYPVGCPVWFNLRYPTPFSKLVTANRGVVKSFSFERGTQMMMYEIERDPSAGKITSPYTTTTPMIPETEVAFAIHCPVLVKAMQWDAKTLETEGRIVNIKFGDEKNGGEKLYTVLCTTNGGNVLVEEGIVTQRIRYKFSLPALQSKLRDIVTSPGNNRAIGIRSNMQEEAMLNKLPPY